MSAKKIAEFPNVEDKLQQPSKQSAYVRQKAESEAKRKRDEAETAAVYQDFVKSFDQDSDGDDGRGNGSSGGGGGGRSGGRAGQFGGTPVRPGAAGVGLGTGKRHFGSSSATGLKSGPGSLGPAAPPTGPRSGPGSLGPPPASIGKKRTYDGRDASVKRAEVRDYSPRRAFDFDDRRDTNSTALAKAFVGSDDEDEQHGVAAGGITGGGADRNESGRDRDDNNDRAIAKPTIRLANLPPSTSPAVVKALIQPSGLAVDNVKMLPPGGPTGTDRKSTAAIVTLSAETGASDIDTVVSALQNQYLGFGYYLSLHRHLSSAAISGAGASVPGALTAATTAARQPFGAKPVEQDRGASHRNNDRFAPPTSYGPSGGPLNRNIMYVPIDAPKDIKQLRMIHKVIENILEHGPEFEALLMSRAAVQKEEKWAWIWDARSAGGIWYRWRLWEILTGSKSKSNRGRYLPIFEDSNAWKAPERPLAYEFTTQVDGFITDSEYNSSDEEDYDDEPERKQVDAANRDPEETFLNPIEKAKLVHLLSRLPKTLAKLRKGDVARISSFALTHSSKGAAEVAELIVSNVEKPFALSRALIVKSMHDSDSDLNDASPAPADKADIAADISGATLVALYVVSDILSSSSTSGIRHAWRYRQLFEAQLKHRMVLETLGLLGNKLELGRLRVEKWKRSVGIVLSLWEGWCCFSNESQAQFVSSFENPPSAAVNDQDEGNDDTGAKAGGKWKSVDATTPAPLPVSEAVDDSDDDESYDEYTDDEDADNELLTQYPIDGESMLDLDIEGMKIEWGDSGGTDSRQEEVDVAKGEDPDAMDIEPDAKNVIGNIKLSTSGVSGQRKRMRAADMFAGSDSEGEK